MLILCQSKTLHHCHALKTMKHLVIHKDDVIVVTSPLKTTVAIYTIFLDELLQCHGQLSENLLESL